MAMMKVLPLASQGRKRSLSPEKEEPSTKKARKVSPNLLICFDLEMTDGSFASEIFQVIRNFTVTCFRLKDLDDKMQNVRC